MVRGRKILGICLGQQLMAEYGEEDGGCPGLGFVAGQVTRLPSEIGWKVPHVGFNTVRFAQGSRLCRGMKSEQERAADHELDCYVVHSYRLEMADRPGLHGICDYGGEFVAAYEHENIFATQFHPEKSQTNGLRLLANFLAA